MKSAAMAKITSFTFLLGVLLTGRSVVADDACPIATGNKTNAHLRRVSAIPLGASATDAVSATTSHLTTSGAVTNALPPLPPDVNEFKFSDFFRQPIGPRGLEHTDRLRSLEGRRIRIPIDATQQTTHKIKHDNQETVSTRNSGGFARDGHRK
jgi:hypothetical protein